VTLHLLLDACLPAEAIATLGGAGYDISSVRDLLAPETGDRALLARARELTAVPVVLDDTFPLAVLGAERSGAIALQLADQPERLPPLLAVLVAYLRAYPEGEHYRNTLVCVYPTRAVRRTYTPVGSERGS